MATKLTIKQGSTFTDVVRWEIEPIVYKAITGITKAAPVVITAVGHGLKDGWRVAVVSVLGMRQINAVASCDVIPDDQYHPVTVVDADHVSLNDINSAQFTAYTSGGYLQFNTPKTLSGYTARMTIKDRIGGATLLSLTTANSRIAIDATALTITLTISATDTAAITWTNGVFDLEMVSGAGFVTTLLSGTVVVTQEVTT